jgi:drug/metabolite transporter (DMT)-like permease
MPSELTGVRTRCWALVLIWAVPLLWTVNMVVARRAPGMVSPHVLALGRWAIAGVILAALSSRELWAHRADVWQQRSRYVALGACGMWICGAWLMLGEPLGWHHLAGSVLILSGVGLVMAVRKP